MTTSYSEASTHVLCDIVYVADNATANRIFLRVVETAEWLEHDQLDNVAQYVDMAFDPLSTDLCRRLAVARVALTRVAARIIAEET